MKPLSDPVADGQKRQILRQDNKKTCRKEVAANGNTMSPTNPKIPKMPKN